MDTIGHEDLRVNSRNASNASLLRRELDSPLRFNKERGGGEGSEALTHRLAPVVTISVNAQRPTLNAQLSNDSALRELWL
jgi:hypothetical protein